MSTREAFRDRLLEIIGLRPNLGGQVGAPGEAGDIRYCVLWFDRPIGDLDRESIIASIRRSHPKVGAAFVDRGRKWRDLPRGFGASPSVQAPQDSPVARAAAAQWGRIERASALAQAKDRTRAAVFTTPSPTR